MANTANGLSTNFNVTPYYDDYDEMKEFYRILYKPGYAVQARELTQMQTILQKQIDRFGKHVFTEGSIVIPGAFQLYSANTLSSPGPLNYVKVSDVDTSNNVVNINDYADTEVIGATSNVKGHINIVKDGTEISGNTKTLYVDYGGYVASSNTSIKTFIEGETLISPLGNLKVLANNAIGYGSAFRISSGVVFSKGHFIWFPTQEVILERYNDVPTCKVGFEIVETIVSSTSDSSLLDPALEASNYSAPGADRFKLTAELQVRTIDDPEDIPDFVTLFTIKDGIVQTIAERTQYSILKDEWAKRTFDESGDYYVSGLDIDLREHKNSGTNGGVFSSAQGGNNALLSVKVNPGVAYVKGYEVGTLVPTYLTTEKSTAYANVENQRASALFGSYITVEDMVGHLPTDTGVEVDLYDTYQNRIANGTFSSTSITPSGAKIGTARIVGIEYNSGTLGAGPATAVSGQADIYLMNITMTGSNNFQSVKSVFCNNSSTPDFLADIVPDPAAGTTVLYEPFNSPLLFATGSNFTRNIRNTSGTPDTSYEYAPTTSVTITNGVFTASAPGSDSLPYSGTLTSTKKRELFLCLGFAVNVATGIVATNVSGNTIVGTNFNKLNIGDKLEFSGLNQTSSNIFTIVSKSNSTHLVVDKNPPNTLSGNSVFKAYKTGEYVDLNTLGFTTGTERSVSAAGTQLTVDLNETALSGSATFTYRANRTVAKEAAKTLRPNRYVQINAATNAAGTAGPYALGFSDVLKIRQIRKKTGAFTSNTEGTDVTSQFIIDNGQKDTHYGFARITPTAALSATDCLLVELDYFIPDYSQGKGYFSIDSYPVDDANSSSTTISTAEIPVYKSSSTGLSYDLRNYLDFRPVKSITAADSTTVAGATVNPSTTSTFNYSGTGISLIAPSSEIVYDYSYYLGRRDVVHVNKDKIFTITKGTPAAIPMTPQISDNEMALAVINIAPYPSISPYYAKLIGRQDISSNSRRVAAIRQTMRDIGVMKERIANLEYYASLSLLEKSAVDMLITDEAGNDRFKNGVFVDTFTDHLLGATYEPDYRIVVDPDEKAIRPLYSMQSIDYEYLTGSGVQKTGDIVTLQYSEVEFANVYTATSTLSTEKTTFRYIGVLTLFPPEDVWVDTITLPPNTVELQGVTLDGMGDAQQQGGVTTTWNAWQTSVVGYKVYRGTGTNRTLIGTYTSALEANRAAQNARTTSNGASIETLYKTSRTGTEYFTYADSDSTSIGSRVVNTEIIPYIRPQTLTGTVTGLKPYAKYKVFFDGIDMSDYTRPITETEFGSLTTITTWTNALGADMFANDKGELWFRLTLPNTDNLRFTVGQKKVLVTDSMTASDDATSFAEKTFFAQGVRQTKQDTILSTRNTEVRQRTVTESTNSSTFSTLPPLPPPPPPPPAGGGGGGSSSQSCMAYALPIKAPDGVEGLFVTAVEVFCAEKHPTLDVWFEIRELDAGQNITLNQVPNSGKWVKNADVPISTDGITNGLKVTFDSPIFLYADKSYAFVIHPDATNPNYYFWISRIGETDVNSGKQVNSRIDTGTTFTTNNDTIWLPRDLVDITCRWYRASFIPAGQFEVGNKPKEKLYINNLQGSIEGFGEPIVTGDRLTLTGYSGPTITANDYIVGANSSVNSQVLSVTGGAYYMSNIRYSQGESATIRYASNAAIKGTATISSVVNGRGFLEYYKEAGNTTFMILNNSNGAFTVGESVFDISDEGSATITAITNQRYSLIDFEPSFINFVRATQSFEIAAYSNTGTPQAYMSIEAGENHAFDTEMAVYSRANEIKDLSSARSNKVRVTMQTTTDYLSPVFDLLTTHSIIVDNLINNDSTGETAPSGGNLFNKYISKIVTLAEGQDAEDLKVYVTGYRPPGSDIKVWLKILNGEDSDTIKLKSWIELEKNFGGDILYSSLSNKQDFKEFTFNIPASYMTGSQGQLQYTNSQGIQFTGFKSFQIKIGLLGTNSAIVPRVADLRTIALQI